MPPTKKTDIVIKSIIFQLYCDNSFRTRIHNVLSYVTIIYVFVCVYICVCVCVCVCVCMYVCVCVYLITLTTLGHYIYKYLCVYVCVCVCVWFYMSVCNSDFLYICPLAYKSLQRAIYNSFFSPN